MEVGEERTARGHREFRIAFVVLVGLVGAAFCCGIAGYFMEPNGRAHATKISIGTVETGLKLYRARHGEYPNADQGPGILVQERILDKPPRDEWGNNFAYRSEGGKYNIISYGRDGRPGGNGADADISNAILEPAQRAGVWTRAPSAGDRK